MRAWTRWISLKSNENTVNSISGRPSNKKILVYKWVSTPTKKILVYTGVSTSIKKILAYTWVSAWERLYKQHRRRKNVAQDAIVLLDQIQKPEVIPTIR